MSTETQMIDAETPILRVAVVRTPVAPMHGEPRIASQMVSQQIAGHAVSILEQDGDWARARGTDRYEGWMHAGFLAPPQPNARLDAQTARISLGCATQSASGERRALPLRAVLGPDEAVRAGEIVDATRVAARFPLEATAIVASAQEYFSGTSYLWGGVTPWGADCSGLVQSIFALHGLELPRDAWQQAQLGRHAGDDIGELRPADLLFFSDRSDQRITHVGIARGDRRMVHLALGRGGYAVERLSDRTDAYVDRLRERFLFARRLL